MKTTEGELIELALNGRFDAIVHGCNCFNTMGAGIARQIRSTFPAAYEADLKTERGSKDKLGTISVAKVADRELYIVNAYTQYGYGVNIHTGETAMVDYAALRSCFKRVKEEFPGRRIGYPKIGAGLAGGDWNIIKNIIDEELAGEDHTLVEFKDMSHGKAIDRLIKRRQ